MIITMILLIAMIITRSIRRLFTELDSDYYKPIRTDDGFAGRNNNYIEYMSKRDRYEFFMT